MSPAGPVCGRETPSPMAAARTAVEMGPDPGVEMEAYVEYGRTVVVKIFGRQVESVAVAEPRGLGVRAVRDGRTGYAFMSDLSAEGIRRAALAATDNLRAADTDAFAGLPSGARFRYPLVPGVWRPGLSATTLESKTALALKAEAAALAMPQVQTVEESVYSDEESHVAVASTMGVEVEGSQSFCVLYVMAHAGYDGERQSGLGFSAGREPDELDAEQAGREAAQKAGALIGARPCATGRYSVVLDREVAAALLSSAARALSADAVQKGRSVFAGRLGDRVASSVFGLTDDGLAAEGMAGRPFDGEGVPRQATVLIENGILRSFLHSSYTARKEQGTATSTGNGNRGSYRVLPNVTATNLVVPRGEGSLEALIARTGEGLYVDSLSGLNSGVNVVSGEISVGATGRLIEGGSLGAPVREVTIAGDFLGLLGGVKDIAADERWIPLYGSVCTPSIAVEGITVSGMPGS